MPKSTTKGNSVLDSLDNSENNKAVKSTANDKTTYGFTSLPPGIEGIAKLDTIKFDRYKSGPNEGKAYFQARGIIVEPDSVKNKQGTTVKIRGRQTMIQIPLCKTTSQAGKVTSFKDNVKRVQNELRKLGGDTSGVESVSDLGPIADQLLEDKPCFNFATSARQGGDGIWENWNGNKGLEDYVPEELEEEDNSAASNGEASTEEGEEEVTEEEGEEGEAVDDGLDELLEVANDDSHDDQASAQAELEEKAKEAGLSKKEIAAIRTYDILVEKIREKTGEGEESSDDDQAEGETTDETTEEEAQESEEEETIPSKTDLFHYKPLDPKTKKPVKKPIEGEVVAVDKKKKTVDLKDMATKKVIKGVAWTKLIVIPD